jgi:hypothetical protein
MPAFQGFQGAAMRRVQDDTGQKDFCCALLNKPLTIVDRALFPAQNPPGAYDQTTLNFYGVRKQAVAGRAVLVPHCSPAPLNNSRSALSGGISGLKEFSPKPDFRLLCCKRVGGKL